MSITSAIAPKHCPVLRRPPLTLPANASLFLDLDGTLLEIMDRPDLVRADDGLRDLLRHLAKKLDGRVAIVSGRSLIQIDEILGVPALDLIVSGSHGAEFRYQGETVTSPRSASLDRATKEFSYFAAAHPDIILEEKTLGVALHYRRAPSVGPKAEKLAAEIATKLGLFVQSGKMMVELRMGDSDKGSAVHDLMHLPAMKGSLPIFIGDDVTDEAGFRASLALDGYGILVGAPRMTAALYAVPHPVALRAWLAKARL